jgi:hypothetical protein
MSVPVEALEELAAEAQAALREAENALREARAKVEDLRDEARVLQSILNRRREAADPNATTPSTIDADVVIIEEEDWSGMPRTIAVEQALEELHAINSSTVGPSEIESYIHARKRDDAKDAVSGALAHLQRTKRAHRTGYAKWLPGPEPDKIPGDAVGATSPGLVTTERSGGDDLAAGPDAVPDHDPTLGERDDRDHHRETANPVAIQF